MADKKVIIKKIIEDDEIVTINEIELKLLYNKIGKLAAYEKALRFYANKENYEVTDEDLDPVTDYIHIVDADEGYLARRALDELLEEDK